MKHSFININGVLSAAVASGIKNAHKLGNNQNKKLDLSLIKLADDTQTAAVFTQNIFCASPILVAKNHLQYDIKALLINSGNANAGTGVGSASLGLKNAYQTCQMAAEALGIKAEQVLPFSTGVIGQPLPIACFANNISQLTNNLKDDNLPNVAKAILTTDLVEKTASAQIKVNGKIVNITGIAKGSGMICPDMATMLCFIFTDVIATKSKLQNCLSVAVNQSFNRITVDGDTSTNDACSLSATGKSGVDIDEISADFQQVLNKISQTLAHKIIKDGEGATKFVEIAVSGAKSSEDCLQIAYTVAHSPLVKTALFAEDANWGRILAAVGRAHIAYLRQSDVSLYLGEICLIKNGQIDPTYTEEAGSKEMQKSQIVIQIKVGNSDYIERVWTTDLSYDYIKINAGYRS